MTTETMPEVVPTPDRPEEWILDLVDEKTREDIKALASTLGRDEARFLANAYFEAQTVRKRTAQQRDACIDDGEPHNLLDPLLRMHRRHEAMLQRALDVWVRTQPAGVWATAQDGVGPISAAYLVASIEIERAPTAGAIWKFAGLVPGAERSKLKKGHKRWWNAELKTVCWRLGDVFVKRHNQPTCFYGQIYAARKVLEVQRNEAGEFSDQAAQTLAEKEFRCKKTKAIYESGKLPPGRIDLRARRVALKLFLSHLWEVMYRLRYPDQDPPKPWVIAIGGHVDYVPPPPPVVW